MTDLTYYEAQILDTSLDELKKGIFIDILKELKDEAYEEGQDDKEREYETDICPSCEKEMDPPERDPNG